MTACERASERFRETAQLSVELYRDPEFDDQYLTLYVRQERYQDDILKAIEGLSGAYEGELSGRAGWFLVTTDFEQPR